MYFNSDHIHDTVLAWARATQPPVRHVVGDLSAAPHLDVAGAEMFKALAADLKAMGAALQLVGDVVRKIRL